MNDCDVKAIERATVAALGAQAVEEHGGWLLPFDTGTIARAKAAVPLGHGAFDASPAETVDFVQARYGARGMPTLFRLADVPSLGPMRSALQHKGWIADRPTWVLTARAQAMRRVSESASATVDPAADDAWAALFLGEGVDPVDGASRVASLRRAIDARYVSVRDGGRAVACGMLAFGHGWASVHGMRTDMAERGRGLAGRVLATMAEVARARGVERVFLQVEENNAAARSLYRRASFSDAWRYRYWQHPD
ncbi:GNAT family N-acetyltransferase [Variovorax sp. PAMC 28711]|uniref:GNAT family N-acetyltransferase n=1 Tax=Variovorax sp. PAMC 28711 TaxID=1795631 RepID=UPI00078EE107|nr:GNAT family N-acetyltransferase [Variovorax sp. PAMC 28711]AMM24718.1 GCN5 family acetyltransferase [Variovorax sp. PAMC 28711]